jgi:hypothetical protein
LVQWENRELQAELGHPNVFYTLAAAQTIANEFLPDKSYLHILGIALPQTLVEDFLSDNQQTTFSVEKQTYEDTLYGINAVLREAKPPEAGASVIGHEVLSSYGLGQIGHSWLCSGLERDMHDLFNIRPNPHGLIDSLADAMRVYAWIAEDEQKGHRAEPEPYYPWLLVDYPLNA